MEFDDFLAQLLELRAQGKTPKVFVTRADGAPEEPQALELDGDGDILILLD